MNRRPQAFRLTAAQRRRRAFWATVRAWAVDLVAALFILGGVVSWLLLLAMFDPQLAPAIGR